MIWSISSWPPSLQEPTTPLRLLLNNNRKCALDADGEMISQIVSWTYFFLKQGFIIFWKCNMIFGIVFYDQSAVVCRDLWLPQANLFGNSLSWCPHLLTHSFLSVLNFRPRLYRDPVDALGHSSVWHHLPPRVLYATVIRRRSYSGTHCRINENKRCSRPRFRHFQDV